MDTCIISTYNCSVHKCVLALRLHAMEPGIFYRLVIGIDMDLGTWSYLDHLCLFIIVNEVDFIYGCHQLNPFLVSVQTVGKDFVHGLLDSHAVYLVTFRISFNAHRSLILYHNLHFHCSRFLFLLLRIHLYNFGWITVHWDAKVILWNKPERSEE